MKVFPVRVVIFSLLIGLIGTANAATLFSDNFDAGASSLWGNEAGTWIAAGGVYNAEVPSNFPNAHSSLPYSLANFSIELDINDVQDGGVWLRSAAAPGTSVGRIGVLLVTGGHSKTGTGLYWHIITDGSGGEPIINEATGLFTVGVSDPHIRVDVTGDTYSAFVNGSSTPATTLTSGAFTSGQVALYDFSNQTFDNVSLSKLPVPLPATAWLFGSGLVGLLGFMRRGCTKRKN